jgi:hypothetical protein
LEVMMDRLRWYQWQVWRLAKAVPDIRALGIPVIDALGEWRRLCGCCYACVR